jgi:hypothetical protein
MGSNDYQLHFFDSMSQSDCEEDSLSHTTTTAAAQQPNKKVAVITMFIDAHEDANYKFALEQKSQEINLSKILVRYFNDFNKNLKRR